MYSICNNIKRYKEGFMMRQPFKRLLFWSPRIICILFALFLSLFALDVFGESHGVWKTILALSIHLIPTYIVIAVLIASWRWEWIGGILFIFLGILYFAMWHGHWSAYLIISGPLFVLGGLFFLNWYFHEEIRSE
jgi:hypothetical protein